MFNQINISSGHSINCQGAADIINEVTEARKVVDRIYEICKSLGIEVYKYHDTASSSSQNLTNIVNWHNQFKDGIDISIHFNAYQHTDSPMGTEVCYYNQSQLASSVSSSIAETSGLKNRGAKERTGLYFLKHTNKPAILIEVCFCDSVADVDLYNKNFDAICESIVKALTGKESQPTKKHIGEYLNVKPFMGTSPVFKTPDSFELWNRKALLNAPISYKIVDNPSPNVYEVETALGNGFVYYEENNNVTFTSYKAYDDTVKEEPKMEETPIEETQTEPEVIYRVVVGSYKDKANAEYQVAKLKEAGFDSFITTK